ncbi:MAG: N-acetylglutaminylglutamine amidotransferase [Chromatiaceae bacterium]|nr:N-acetylglutaminylglutamine amidotransferase [Gammaproteobacteria bacterium]MCP5301482.1 N-acetylglutaminylglutamine amidotransferase [Chromatiaceae bacterium]MCP5423046.1 N-acetylglutaminylglutamine amidotransferase [Chromatiaceae bacterium]
MCGICGEIRFDGRPPSIDAIARMNDLLFPRGPDGSGIFQARHLAVGHRRLKILDLSEHAQQPMVDNELGLGIVFNGCIYNFRDLRVQLQGLGHRFFSDGDTEVILKAYAAWGADCVEHFQGMFAFAIWERDSGRLFLARDRLGIKPLYYAEIDAGLRFASTLPALLATDGIDRSIDPVALHHYMSFHAVVPAPHTILAGVRKLPPATVRMIEPDGRSRDHCYWRLQFGPRGDDRERDYVDWQDITLQALRKAVERRLVADVPVGVLLSGGLDSSLIVGLLAEQGQHGLSTFSVGFEAVDGEAGDEFQYSDIVARHFATDHHQIRVDSARLLPALDRCITAMSEPMVSHDVIGFYLLSEQVSQHVKVVQSGQGADEVFAGYHWYPPLLASIDPAADYAGVFFDRDHAEYAQAVNPELVSDDFSRTLVERHFAAPGAQQPVDKALRLDTQVMLVDDPVKRVDNMTMAWGLEARVPFLDHELVELAARIPAEHKIASGGKGVLKEAARSVIPAAVIDRPKGYFPVPALKYLEGPYLDYVTETLEAPAARQRGLFRDAYVAGLLADPKAHITPLRGSKLWQIALLERWLQQHGVAA